MARIKKRVTSTLPNNQDALGTSNMSQSTPNPIASPMQSSSIITDVVTSFAHGDAYISARCHGQEIAGIYPYQILRVYEHQWDRPFDPFNAETYGDVEEHITVATVVLCSKSMG